MNFQQVLQQSTWFSESYGDDLITISKRHIKSGAKFYIGVYCQFKCKYKLTAYLNEMVEINEFIFVIILIEYLCFDDISVMAHAFKLSLEQSKIDPFVN